VEGPAVCLDGKTEPGDDSPTGHSLKTESEPQVPPLRYAPVGMTNLRAVAHLGMGGGGWTEPKESQFRQDRTKMSSMPGGDDDSLPFA
jgi:hypothetical protein